MTERARLERPSSPRVAAGKAAGARTADSAAQRLSALQSSAGNAAVVKLLAQEHQGHADSTVHQAGETLRSAGPALSRGGVPASFVTPQGLPAARYNLPNVTAATAAVITPNAVIELELLLRGNVQVTPPRALPGVSLDQSGFRAQADTVVDGLNRGMRLNGIGSGEVSIGTTWGTDLVSNEFRWTPPNRFAYIGQATVNANRSTPTGVLNVRGQVGFELRATVVPLPQRAPEPITETWWDRNRGYVVGAALIVGAGLLAVGTVAEDVVTGGLGVADDPASFAAAGAMATAGAAAF